MNDQAQTIQHLDPSTIRTPVTIRPVDPAHVARLAESIKRHGQEVPVTVHRTSHPDVYDLGPGRHRLEAIRSLGLPLIAAIVKPAVSFDVLISEQVRENLDRKDLTPIQEARICASILDARDVTPADVAAIVGRSERWVQLRVALVRLHPKVLEMVDAGALPLGHAQLIASVPDQDEQLRIAERVRARKTEGYLRSGERRTDVLPAAAVYEVRRMVQECGRPLDDAGWLKEAVFGKHGACATCPHNSARRGDLFEDAERPKAATCLDASCYAEKATLTGRGARKAAFFLVNEKLPRDTNAALAAAKARDVTYVRPERVLDAAKRVAAERRARANPDAGGEKGVSKPAQITPKTRLGALRTEWVSENSERLERAVKGKPAVLALLHLVGEIPGCSLWGRQPKGALARGTEILRKAGEVDGALLLRAARLVDQGARVPNLRAELIVTALTALGADVKPEPTLADAKASLKADRAAAAKARA